MKIRLAALTALCLGMLVWAIPASAGGWAVVHLDAVPSQVFAGKPVKLTFLVKQHDVTPVYVDRAYLEATNRETGEELSADAQPAAEVGHYTIDITFPSAGPWKWKITPAPFEGTSFATLNVLPASNASANPSGFPEPLVHPAAIRSGPCGQTGSDAFPLNDAGSGRSADGVTQAPEKWLGAEQAQAVGTSETTVETNLADFDTKLYSIVIYKSENPADGLVACGNIGGPLVGDGLMIGLDQVDGSGDVGIATLHSDGDKTIVTLYTFVTSNSITSTSQSASTNGATVEITIAGASDGAWLFDPPTVTIPAGTTVIWSNETDVAHTIQSDSIDFDDSGLLDAGSSFSETFDKPGTYSYACGPHPWMTGTITVE